MKRVPICIVYRNSDGTYDIQKCSNVSAETLVQLLQEMQRREDKPDAVVSCMPIVLGGYEG